LLKKIIHHFHGETPHPRDVVAVYLCAAGAGIAVIWTSPEKQLVDWCMAFLAADLAGGIISNATLSTRQYYQKQGVGARNTFLVLHAGVYPAVIIWLVGVVQPLGLLMLVGCATKVCLFAVPQIKTKGRFV
jgi:hypothetical protein